MMIRAYREIYLSKAQSAMGDAFDYAINGCDIPGSDFIKLFVSSSICRRMENAEPQFLVGKSGIEIAIDVIFETTGRQPEEKLKYSSVRSPEYWIGWAVCYYQWYSTRNYRDLFTKFVEIADEKIREYFVETNLKRLRTAYGLSQAELAERSGVMLRSIQMYEQRRKNINKAGAETLYRISRTLGCTMEELLEK